MATERKPVFLLGSGLPSEMATGDVVPVRLGGTGGSTAEEARANLGITGSGTLPIGQPLQTLRVNRGGTAEEWSSVEYIGGDELWSAPIALPVTGRKDAVLAAVAGKIYFGLGRDSAGTWYRDFWMYDPIEKVWTAMAAFSGESINNGRIGASAVGVNTTTWGPRVYVGFGQSSSSGNPFCRDLYAFTPNATTGTWTRQTDFPLTDGRKGVFMTPYYNGGSSFFYAGFGYSSAGTKYADLYKFDTTNTGTWTQVTATFNASLTARYNVVGGSYLNKIWLGLGTDGTNSFADWYVFDLTANSCTKLTDFPGGARQSAIGVGIGTKVFVGVGRDSSGTLMNSMYSYNTITNIWSSALVPNQNGAIADCYAASMGSRLFIAGGIDSGGIYKANMNWYGKIENNSFTYGNVEKAWTDDNGFTVFGRNAAGQTKAYRFRTSGGMLDFDFAYADLFLSSYPNTNFSSSQNNHLQIAALSQSMCISDLAVSLSMNGNQDYAGQQSVFFAKRTATGPNTYQLALNKRMGICNVVWKKYFSAPAYQPTTQYYVGDIVSQGGAGNVNYICKLNSFGNGVTNTTYWNCLSDDDLSYAYQWLKYDALTDVLSLNPAYVIFGVDPGISNACLIRCGGSASFTGYLFAKRGMDGSLMTMGPDSTGHSVIYSQNANATSRGIAFYGNATTEYGHFDPTTKDLILKGSVAVEGSVKIGNDSGAAIAENVGKVRYREGVEGKSSYVDMCMKTSDSGYTWVNIVTNTWA